MKQIIKIRLNINFISTSPEFIYWHMQHSQFIFLLMNWIRSTVEYYNIMTTGSRFVLIGILIDSVSIKLNVQGLLWNCLVLEATVVVRRKTKFLLKNMNFFYFFYVWAVYACTLHWSINVEENF